MISFTLRITDDLNNMILESAKKEGVSKNALIIFILRSYFLSEKNRRSTQDENWLAMKESKRD